MNYHGCFDLLSGAPSEKKSTNVSEATGGAVDAGRGEEPAVALLEAAVGAGRAGWKGGGGWRRGGGELAVEQSWEHGVEGGAGPQTGSWGVPGLLSPSTHAAGCGVVDERAGGWSHDQTSRAGSCPILLVSQHLETGTGAQLGGGPDGLQGQLGGGLQTWCWRVLLGYKLQLLHQKQLIFFLFCK